MISTVQWQHAQALLLAGGFASISAFFLVLSAYFLGRRGTPLGREKNLITLGLDNSPDGYLVAGKKGNYLYSNPNFHKLLSFTGSADLARRAVSIDAIIEALDGTGAEQVASLKSGLLNGSSGHTEFSISRRGANVEWRRLSVAPIQQRGEAVIGALWHVEDVTSAREIDGIRRSEEERVTDFLDLLPVGFFSADKEGILQYVNQTFARWVGLPPDHMRGMAFADFIVDVNDEENLILKDTEGRTFSVALENRKKMMDMEMLPIRAQLFCVIWFGVILRGIKMIRPLIHQKNRTQVLTMRCLRLGILNGCLMNLP